MATTPPDGVITLRNSIGENGNLPRTYTAGSPDIIVSGKLPFEDPSILEKADNYDKSYDNTLYIGFPNYLYVRGKNFGTQKVDGSWNLYWSTPNILLYPYLWEANQLATSDGNQDPTFSLAPGAIGASTNAFTWVPPDTQDHYCMIAVAKSPNFPNPLAGVRNVSSLAATMADNANIAQRNLQLVRGNVPQVVSSAAYAQGDEPQTMDIAVLLKNLPKGSSWSAASGTLLNGVTLQHAESNTQVNNFKYAWSDLNVPAQWQTMFSYTMAFGSDWSGIPDGAKPELTIRGEIAMTSTHALYNHPAARLAEPHLLTGEARMCKAGNPIKLMIAGTVTTRCPDIERR
ncbi:MAG: hypothetical protein ABI459_04805 [Deltaproteobacteria bacterium]